MLGRGARNPLGEEPRYALTQEDVIFCNHDARLWRHESNVNRPTEHSYSSSRTLRRVSLARSSLAMNTSS